MPEHEPAPLVVAIDGPAGSGKSTLAKRLADELGWAFLDTGAMYRAVTLAALERGQSLDDAAAMAALARALRIDLSASGTLRVDGADVTSRIRSAEVNAAVSGVAEIAEVRAVMRAHQRRFAQENRRIVAEGRDIGTNVFPDAAVKVFLVGSEDERVRRRVAEMRRTTPDLDPAAVRESLLERDRRDENRRADPLRQAPDAVALDTTGLSPDEVLGRVLTLVRSRVPL
ncbi:MAG TPA: (d)CMP kinase [Planctomycetota bacterium]|nr:(d)CMP kinase [Planctomycetota bacterium]